MFIFDYSIACNAVESLEGLEKLSELESLNVAGNRVSKIGDALQNNDKLKVLNLAANRIVSFAAIQRLSKLENLRTLYFNDPHYGENPICHLCNYHT